MQFVNKNYLKQMEKSQIFLSEDCFFEILSRLPVKSVGRFRCVRKSWYQIISTTSFINAHMKNSISNTNSPYLLCKHTGFYSLLDNQELTNYKPSYYRPKLFGISPKFDLGIKVYENRQRFVQELFGTQLMINIGFQICGCCKGLLCVSNTPLRVNSILYLLNPIIKKVKRIPNIFVDVNEFIANPYLCLGYFDHDYKVIMMFPSRSRSRSRFCAGVYSLSTDRWQIKYCNRNDDERGTKSYWHYKFAKFVNGVAYFVTSYGRIICFDLNDERIIDIVLPNNFTSSTRRAYNSGLYNSFALEEYGESIALMKINGGVFVMWVLNKCCIAKSSTWEKKVTIDLGRVAGRSYPIGFLNNGTYLLRNIGRSSTFYLCNLKNSEWKGFTDEGVQGRLLHIEPFVGNLVLLNEKSIDPFEEKEDCSVQTTFLFNIYCEKVTATKKKRNEPLIKRQNPEKKLKIDEIDGEEPGKTH